MSRRKRPPMTEAEWRVTCERLADAIDAAQAAARAVEEVEQEYTSLAENLIRDVLRPMGGQQRVELLERLYEEVTS